MGSKIDRTGETRENNQGLKITIIKYNSNKDITVQFEDGTIVEHRGYRAFKKGEIAHPNHTQVVDRTGETKINNQNLKMTIIKYNNNRDIDIKFEDGTIIKNKEYCEFTRGTVRNPNHRDIQAIDKTGEIGVNNQGLNMKIIKYWNAHDITVQFEDGTIVENRKYGDFKRGEIANPNIPTTKESKGERLIREYLERNNIIYLPQYTFGDCRHKLPMPFDFAIFDIYNNLICLIEFDGEQHYEAVCFGGVTQEKAEENFKKTQLRDSIKNEYCKNNNIRLIRIPYWEIDNIENILDNKVLIKLPSTRE